MDGTDILSLIDTYIFTRCKLKYLYFARLQKWNLLIFSYIGVTFIEKGVSFIDWLEYISFAYLKFQLGIWIRQVIIQLWYHITGSVV